jgi:L-lysine 6-transaminase
MASSTLSPSLPRDVHATLGRHIFADGSDIVLDLEKSQGSFLFDARSGKSFLDFMTFFASNPIGFNHPKTKDPEYQRLLLRAAQIKPSLSDFYPVEYARFVDSFARHCKPAHLPHLFFIESGALAVENALKVAFDWKVRRNRSKGVPGERGQQIIHFREAFHGRSGYTLSLTNTDPAKTDHYPKFPWPRIDNPKLRFPVTPEVERDVAAAEQRAFAQIDLAFERNPDDIAGILIEPIQGEGGDNHFRPEFLQALQRLCRERECFFILDEVQTGIGMTGTMWAHEQFGLQPDALAFGKKTQCCGVLAGPRVDEEPENVFKVSSRINSTWGGNLTDMVRFMRFLEIIVEDRLLENAGRVGAELLRGLRDIEREHNDRVANARGLGLFVAFDVGTPELRKRLLDACKQNGLLALACGPRSVRFRPPLSLSLAEAFQGLEIVRRSVRSLQ